MKLPNINEIVGKYDALIIDLDGTILDSMSLWNRVDEEFLSKRGYSVTPEYTDFVKSVSIEEGAVYTKEQFSLKESPEEIMNEWNRMVFEAYKNSIRLKAGSFEYIKKAHEAGLKIACATALSYANAEAALSSNHILDLIDKLITLEDVGTGVNKSEPHIYLLTSDAIGIAPERCLVFEDIPVAIRGASSGGFGTCAVYDDIGCDHGKQWQEMVRTSDYCVEDWRTLT